MRRRPSAHLPWVLFLFLIGIEFLFHEFGREYHSRAHHHQAPVATRSEVQPSTSGSSEELTKYGYPVPGSLVGPYHVLTNDGYVCGYDAGIQDPRWVETRFFAVTNPSSTERPREFSPDERIEPEYRVNTHFWTDSGFDRGHMANNWGVSICYGREAQVQTFLLTNVIPQSPELNRGLWETLEKIISNDYAQRYRQVWVICGPIFPAHPTTLHEGKIWIPQACYKIVLRVDDDGRPHCLAFEMPQEIERGHRQADLLKYLTSVSKIEADTGIKFFTKLEEPARTELETKPALSLW